MSYGNNPTTGTQTPLPTNQFPASSVYPPNIGGSNPTHDFKALGGGPIRMDDDNNPYSEALMYTKDGDNETLGAKANAAATDSTSAWSMIAILKGLYALLVGVLLTGRKTVTVYVLASTTTSGTTQNSLDVPVGPYTEISIDINTTAQAGTSPTIQYFWERKGADGNYYVLWQSNVLTAATNTISTSVGAGMAYPLSLGLTGRLRWVIGGSATPTFTHSISVYGK